MGECSSVSQRTTHLLISYYFAILLKPFLKEKTQTKYFLFSASCESNLKTLRFNLLAVQKKPDKDVSLGILLLIEQINSNLIE